MKIVLYHTHPEHYTRVWPVCLLFILQVIAEEPFKVFPLI